MLRASVVWLLLLGNSCGPSFGQDTMGGGTLSKNRQHLAPTGRPCLAISGYAMAQKINPHIFEHRITARNSCGQNIKVKVCYHKTEDCIMIDVPPWDRKDSVLGIYPALGDFKFDAKEQF